MGGRLYDYVGPPEIRERSSGRPRGHRVTQPGDVLHWVAASGEKPAAVDAVAVTFVVDAAGSLLIADRHSEHVACAGGEPVLAAGEMFFDVDPRRARVRVRVAEVSNQSTGYCPEPACWPAVAAALDRAGIEHPGGFTSECTFRRCSACGARNIIKDEWFFCDVCGGALSPAWNFE